MIRIIGGLSGMALFFGSAIAMGGQVAALGAAGLCLILFALTGRIIDVIKDPSDGVDG